MVLRRSYRRRLYPATTSSYSGADIDAPQIQTQVADVGGVSACPGLPGLRSDAADLAGCRPGLPIYTKD